jgi:hypothetical protein
VLAQHRPVGAVVDAGQLVERGVGVLAGLDCGQPGGCLAAGRAGDDDVVGSSGLAAVVAGVVGGVVGVDVVVGAAAAQPGRFG